MQYERAFLRIRHAMYEYAGMRWCPLARSAKFSKCIDVPSSFFNVLNVADELFSQTLNREVQILSTAVLTQLYKN